MSSAEPRRAGAADPGRAASLGSADVGLLTPGGAGSAVEAATGDRAFLQAMPDAKAALTRAHHLVGRAPAAAVGAIGAAARAERYDPRSLTLRARAGGNPVIPLVSDLTAQVGTAGLIDSAELRVLDDPAGYPGAAPALVDRALEQPDRTGDAHDERAARPSAPDEPGAVLVNRAPGRPDPPEGGQPGAARVKRSPQRPDAETRGPHDGRKAP